MAIPEETPRVLHVGNNTHGPFSLSVDGTPISYASKADIVVTRFDAAGAATVLTEGVHYTLSADSALPDVGEETQTITEATLALEADQDALATTERLLIERSTTVAQNQVLLRAGGFSSAQTERNFDAFVRVMQELRDAANRGVRISQFDTADALFLPKVADRAGKFFSFDSLGNPAAQSLDAALKGDTGATGAAGANGTTWFTGSGAPSNGVGVLNDIYLNLSNGDVYTKGASAWALSGNIRGASGAGTGDMLKSDNLSGLASVATARANLGLSGAALLAASAVFQVANNLSEGNAASMRGNLGLGSAALLAATAVLQNANNLSDLPSAATARTNLGLSTAAVLAAMTAAQYWANTASKVATTDTLWSAAAVQTLTDGATVTPDFGAGINFELTLGGNRTLANPSNPKVGQSGVIYLVQDGSGSRQPTFSSYYKWSGGSAPALTTAAGAVDRVSYFVRSATFIECAIAKDVK